MSDDLIYPSEQDVDLVLIGEGYRPESRSGGMYPGAVWRHPSGWRVQVFYEVERPVVTTVTLHPGNRPSVVTVEPYTGLTVEGWLGLLSRAIRARDLPELIPED